MCCTVRVLSSNIYITFQSLICLLVLVDGESPSIAKYVYKRGNAQFEVLNEWFMEFEQDARTVLCDLSWDFNSAGDDCLYVTLACKHSNSISSRRINVIFRMWIRPVEYMTPINFC